MSGLTTRTVGTLFRNEEWWRDQYNVIYGRGYQLPPRYHPNREPSWTRSGKDFFAVEDGQPTVLRATMDAACRRDGKQVMLKKIHPEEGPHELAITQSFSSREFARDPRNHCVPLLDIFETQNGQKLMVLPFLRPFDNPRFQTYGEFVTFFAQICEGLQFMHERNIAHRGGWTHADGMHFLRRNKDCSLSNILFDPSEMYPQGYHPTQMNRSRLPRRYLIDLSFSRQYFSRKELDVPVRGDDKSAPEHRNATRQAQCNPFHTDIYYLGNLVRQELIQKYDGFEFMQDLVDEMTHIDPTTRPSIEVVVAKFSHIRRSQSSSDKLHSPLVVSKHKPRLFMIFW